MELGFLISICGVEGSAKVRLEAWGHTPCFAFVVLSPAARSLSGHSLVEANLFRLMAVHVAEFLPLIILFWVDLLSQN